MLRTSVMFKVGSLGLLLLEFLLLGCHLHIVIVFTLIFSCTSMIASSATLKAVPSSYAAATSAAWLLKAHQHTCL